MPDPLLVCRVSGQVLRQENVLRHRSRQRRNGIIAPSMTSPQYEPSASGVPKRYRGALAYIGWRTITYGPVEITF